MLVTGPAHDRDAPGASASWPDGRLVRACLEGDDTAWAALIDKYKRLIFSVLIRRGASREDAADIFQAVCLELFAHLSNLRRTESLRSWLVTVALNKQYHWAQQSRRERETVSDSIDETTLEAAPALPPQVLAELEQAQIVRESIAQLPDRCREMIRLLFFEHPAARYDDVARRLGLAVGSIGFIRGRCLDRLERLLRKAGVA